MSPADRHAKAIMDLAMARRGGKGLMRPGNPSSQLNIMQMSSAPLHNILADLELLMLVAEKLHNSELLR